MSRLPSVFEIAESTGLLRFFLGAIRTAGLVTALRRSGLITLLTPSDEACERFALESRLDAQARGARARARRVVANHVLHHLLPIAEMLGMQALETSSGERIPVAVEDGIVVLQHARVREADIRARNGILHILDAVLIPSKHSGRPTILGSST